jgi:hypothetical protein
MMETILMAIATILLIEALFAPIASIIIACKNKAK